MDPGYERWLLNHDHLPQVQFFAHAVTFAPLAVRKGMLLYSRVQQPLSGTRLARSLRQLHETTFSVQNIRDQALHPYTLRSLIDDLPHSCSDPLYMGWISMIARSAPWRDYSEIAQVRQATIEKEISAAVLVHHPVEFDYTAILSRDRSARFHRFAPNLPVNPDIHGQIHACFKEAQRRLLDHTFYPRSSRKTIGAFAQQLSRQSLGNLQLEITKDYAESLDDVELLYHETGFKLEGPIEVRVAWKYLDLKPRVYYAQGPSVYHASKFIQEFCNILVDCFPPVHRYNRFETPTEIILSDHVRLAIYDYASFTSKLHEIRRFCQALAFFFRDTVVRIVDTYQGVISVPLGALLQEYTEVCNESAVFDIHRLSPSLEPGEILLVHNCGALGVPGNISLCTLLHGIHTCISRQSLLSSRVVGDDALTQVEMLPCPVYAWQEFVDQMQNVGDISAEKFEFWDDEKEDDDPDAEGWHYTKRPITRMSDRILRGELFVWPSLANIAGLTDGYHTEPLPSLYHRRKKFLTQWKRFLTNIHVSNVSVPHTTCLLVVAFQDAAWKMLNLPATRYGPILLPDGQRFIVPRRMSVDDIGSSWVDFMLDGTSEGVYGKHLLPKFAGVPDAWTGVETERFESRSTRLLSLLVRLGYLEKTLKREEIELTPYMSRSILTQYLELDYDFCYDYVVLRDVPAWVQDIH